MATLQKKPGRKFWYARFQVDGHRYEISTGKAKKWEAENELPRLIAEKSKEATADSLFEAMQERIDKLPAAKRDKKRRELATLLMQGLGSKLEIAKAWEAWSKNPKKRNPSATTMRSARFVDELCPVYSADSSGGAMVIMPMRGNVPAEIEEALTKDNETQQEEVEEAKTPEEETTHVDPAPVPIAESGKLRKGRKRNMPKQQNEQRSDTSALQRVLTLSDEARAQVAPAAKPPIPA
ncbi:MAG: hypothetical protein ISS31_08605 [Kiritimatiellae bacterium]|nr:hypothetical protein [Kiritimatiellia bacterium]